MTSTRTAGRSRSRPSSAPGTPTSSSDFIGEDGYSYLFDGQLGYLDHALASESLAAQVTGVAEWHVNADEPVLFDYNDDVRDAGEAAFERESTVADLDVADARRSSDHDPVVFGLDLGSLHVDDAVIVQKPRGGGTLVLSAHVDGTYTACPKLTLTVEGATVVTGPTTRLPRSTTCVSLTSKGLVTFDLRTGAVAAVLTLPSTFRLNDHDRHVQPHHRRGDARRGRDRPPHRPDLDDLSAAPSARRRAPPAGAGGDGGPGPSGATTGRRKPTWAPPPGRGAAMTLPPLPMATSRTIDRPRPDPGSDRAPSAR